jgi:DNA-directed RNA polymerase subunit K/omega
VVDENLANDPSAEETQPVEPEIKSPPIESRFLFVDVAALRAKQLRRGARPRLAGQTDDPEASPDQPRKPERIAMEEVRQGLVLYDIPVVNPETSGEGR